MSDAQAEVFDLIYGRWRSQTLYAGVKLGVFEVLGEEPKTAVLVAQELGLAPGLLYRLLRAISSLGLLTEYPEQRFALTEAGRLLRSDDPHSLRGVVLLTEGPEHYAIWKHLPAMIRDGAQNGFVREFGEPAFEYAAHTPAYEEAFDNGMSSYSTAQTAWTLEALQPCDFQSTSHVCDVGGGQGHLLGHLLLQYPHLHGTVLDRKNVFEKASRLWAEKLNIADRCRYVAGDMFVDVPAADAYFMKMILHDWNDEECVAILKTMHRRASKGGRIFIVEHVIPAPNTAHIANLFDIHMLCWGTGRERTVEQYAEILHAAGWNFHRSLFSTHGALGVIEGSKD